jgi:hypothetical protein
MEIDEFVRDNIFNHIPASDDRDEVWWALTKDQDGYIMVWEDGQHFHTYRHPEDWY